MLCDPIVMVGYVGERGRSTMSVDSIVRRVVDHSLANIVYSLMTVLISWVCGVCTEGGGSLTPAGW